jgi:uncharacterized integral membrane protein
MTGIRIILVALLAIGLTVLATLNWQTITLSLGGGTEVDIKLPIFVAGLLLLIFVPMWMLGFTRRTLLERKIEKLRAQLEATEAELARAKIELLRPPAAHPGETSRTPAPTDTDADRPAAPGAPRPDDRLPPQAIPQPAPPPGT